MTVTAKATGIQPVTQRHGNAGIATGRADAQGRTWLVPGQTVRVRLPWSEVCMFMRVAETVMDVQLTDAPYPMAQLLKDGRAFSAPVTTGEAGIYGCTREGFYTYAEAGE